MIKKFYEFINEDFNKYELENVEEITKQQYNEIIQNYLVGDGETCAIFVNDDKYRLIRVAYSRFDIVLDETYSVADGITFEKLKNKKILCRNANRLDSRILDIILELINQNKSSVLMMIDANDTEGLENENTEIIMNSDVIKKYKLL